MANIPSPVESAVSTIHDLDRFLAEYAQYLEFDRGLAQCTIERSKTVAQDLVRECFGSEALSWERLRARDVTGFLLRYAKGVKPVSAKGMASGLRRFLRYLQMRGEIATDLASAVPSVADRGSRGDLRSRLEGEQVKSLLANCDRTKATGRRDYAILLLLARLGLRAGEVFAMELSDVDWRAGVLTVRGKGPRLARLPLPQDVGQALSTYIVQARPACASQRIFLRLWPVVEEFSSSGAISKIVLRGLRRARLTPKHKGAHLLRHSLAAEMLRKGACLNEIGQILRHHSWATTELYARVDLRALQGLARPWPGGEA